MKLRIAPDESYRTKYGYLIRLIISAKGRTVPYSLNIYVNELEDWDYENHVVKSSDPKFKRKNLMLQTAFDKAEKTLDDLALNGKLPSSAKKIRDLLAPVREVPLFNDYYREILKTKEKGTFAVYDNTIKQIELLMGKEIEFEDTTMAWLRKFETKRKNKGAVTNTVSIDMRNIRSVFNTAITDRIISADLYPFRSFKIKSEETRKRSLTKSQLIQLRDFETDKREYVDIFMLIFYLIGINAIDLLHAKESDVVDGRLEYRRAKTSKLYSVKIEPEAQEIIDRYKGKNFLLNICDRYDNYKNYISRLNKSLKLVGTEFEIGKQRSGNALFPELSSYWARHTWATIAAEIDTPDAVISQALGHSAANKITEVYIKRNQKKVDEANRTILDYIKQ